MIPSNKEHVEAELEERQRKTNEERAKFIESLEPQIKKKFLASEKIVGRLVKLKVPFLLFVNPLKSFEDGKPGFYWYQKFHSSEDYLSKESGQEVWSAFRDLSVKVFNFMTSYFSDWRILIERKEQRTVVWENGSWHYLDEE
jgi:hypothetical protein